MIASLQAGQDPIALARESNSREVQQLLAKALAESKPTRAGEAGRRLAWEWKEPVGVGRTYRFFHKLHDRLMRFILFLLDSFHNVARAWPIAGSFVQSSSILRVTFYALACTGIWNMALCFLFYKLGAEYGCKLIYFISDSFLMFFVNSFFETFRHLMFIKSRT